MRYSIIVTMLLLKHDFYLKGSDEWSSCSSNYSSNCETPLAMEYQTFPVPLLAMEYQTFPVPLLAMGYQTFSSPLFVSAPLFAMQYQTNFQTKPHSQIVDNNDIGKNSKWSPKKSKSLSISESESMECYTPSCLTPSDLDIFDKIPSQFTPDPSPVASPSRSITKSFHFSEEHIVCAANLEHAHAEAEMIGFSQGESYDRNSSKIAPKKRRRISKWTDGEDEKLKQLYELKGNKWKSISTEIIGKTAEQCAQRWTKVLDPSLKKGRWTEDEDKLLLEGFEKIGGRSKRWQRIANYFPEGKKKRNGKQCRDRHQTLTKKEATLEEACLDHFYD